MTTLTASPDLQDLLTVMDTLDIFQEADRAHLDASEVRRRVRTVYASQDLPLDERALHHAVELFLHPDGPPQVALAPTSAPVPAVIAPAPVVPAQAETTPHRGGFGLLELMLVFGIIMGSSCVMFTVFGAAKRAVGTNLAANITTALAADNAEDARAILAKPDAKDILTQAKITATVTEDAQWVPQVTLTHVDADTALTLARGLANASPQAQHGRRGGLLNSSPIPLGLRMNRVAIERVADAEAMATTCERGGIACPNPKDLTLTFTRP